MSRRKLKPHDTPAPDGFLSIQIEWHRVIDELERESDRGVALIAAAYLDTALRIMLESSLAGGQTIADKLFNSPNAPLGTFSSRIAMAYGLGHIGPKYFSALESIREIRNAFAHFHRTLTFGDPEIRKWIESTSTLPYVLPHPAPDLSLMRNRYIWTAAMILGRISHAQRTAVPPPLPENA
jgi:DNA-binding MltR family transcriptional regulator